MSTTMNPVVVENLHVSFRGNRVLTGVDLELRRGSATALVGANAAGKSTLLRVLIGTLAPDAGGVRVLGLDPLEQGARVRARIGYVADRLQLPNWMRARDWLRFVSRLYPTWSRAEERRLCDLLGFDASAGVRELSKGSRAKLALVTALAHAPALLLLDEPFSGLDVDTRRLSAKLAVEFLREEGRSVLLVSHSIGDIELVCDRVAVLAEGRIRQHDELERFAAAPRGGIDLEAALCRAQSHKESAA